jgi:hypothetical protein
MKIFTFDFICFYKQNNWIKDYKDLIVDIIYLKCINLGDIAPNNNHNDKIQQLKTLFLYNILQ